MELTLTQAILWYFKQMNTSAQKIEFDSYFVKLLLDGPSTYSKDVYQLFVQRFKEAVSKHKDFRFKTLRILDENFYPSIVIPPSKGVIPVSDGYAMPDEYYADSASYIEENLPKLTAEFINTTQALSNDSSRRVFETTLALSTLANISDEPKYSGFGSNGPFCDKILQWNRRLYLFLKKIHALAKCLPHTPEREANLDRLERFLHVYEQLRDVILEIDNLPKPERVFIGDWGGLNHSVAHEVYDIIKIICQSYIEQHDARMNLSRRTTIKAVALSWLLIRTVVDCFNESLKLLPVLYNFIDIQYFRGRAIIDPTERNDRSISPDGEPWNVTEWGINHARTVMPRYEGSSPSKEQVPTLLSETSSIPTYYKIPSSVPKYTFPKSLEIARVEPDSIWALYCRERKVHTMIGGGSGSFFYISRTLLSTQDNNSYKFSFDHFGSIAWNINLRSDFTCKEFFEFIKILSSLWVGVCGGHCFLEILFTLNMQPVVKEYKSIFGFDSSCSLTSMLGEKLRVYIYDVIKQAADYNSNFFVSHKLVLDEFKENQRALMYKKFQQTSSTDDTVPMISSLEKFSQFKNQRNKICSVLIDLLNKIKYYDHKQIITSLIDDISEIRYQPDASDPLIKLYLSIFAVSGYFDPLALIQSQLGEIAFSVSVRELIRERKYISKFLSEFSKSLLSASSRLEKSDHV